MKHFVLMALLFLLPFVLWEELLRHKPEPPFWYEDALGQARDAQLDFLFIGSSRVGAAIDSGYFEAGAEKALGRKVRAVNLGMGYSTLAEHTLAIKRLYRLHPEHLRGTTIFVETLAGIPSSETWQTSWVHQGWPDLIIPSLGWADLYTFWNLSTNSRADKFYVTAGKFLRLSGEAVRLRRRFWNEGNVALTEYLTRSAPRQAYDLSSAAGVRTDDAGVTAARKLAIEISAAQLKGQQPIRDWEGAIVHDLTRFVTAQGGAVVFFATPLSSVEGAAWRTPLRQADLRAFEKVAAAWGSTSLTVDFVAPDSDFPDLWRLRQSRKQDYTDALASAYLQSKSGPRP